MVAVQQEPVTQGLTREHLVGRTLRDGEYHVIRLLGQGSIGKVYLVVHTSLSIVFALKQLPADKPLPESAIAELDAILLNEQYGEYSTSGHLIAPMMPTSGGPYTDIFLHEALFLARLRHPAIPALYDYFFEDGYWYLVMEYIAGQTLAVHLRQNAPLVALEALNYAMQFCEILDYLHKQTPAIVFRDIKPANVMVTPDNTLVLIDFGLAQYVTDEWRDEVFGTGSPVYAAPEQYQEHAPDVRSDLYSLGILLYEMLSARRPRGSDPPKNLHLIKPDISYAVSSLVTIAMQGDIEQRFQSAYTFYLALERAYGIEERRAYQNQALLSMGACWERKDTILLPVLDETEKEMPVDLDEATLSDKERELVKTASWTGSVFSLEQRRQTREFLYRSRQERLEQEQLEVQLASVDESLKRRSYTLSHLPLRPQEERSIPAVVKAPHRKWQRIIQTCFILVLVVFLILASLLMYVKVVPRLENALRVPVATSSLSPTASLANATATVQGLSGTWRILPPLPVPAADNAAVYLSTTTGAAVYMNSGYSGVTLASGKISYSHNVYRYDPVTMHWDILSSQLPAMVNNAATIDENNHVFFTAGYAPETSSVASALYLWQPDSGSFQKINAPAEVRVGFGNALYADRHGHLYMTQGFQQAGNQHEQAGNGWYRFDIATSTWHVLVSLPVGLGYVTLAGESDGSIVLLGGSADAGQEIQSNKIYRYDVSQNSWSQDSDAMPQFSSGSMSCQVWPGQIVLMGGYDANHKTGITSAWLFNTSDQHWQPLPDLPTGGGVLGTATCDGNGHVYVSRGADDPGKPTNDFLQLTVPQNTR